MTKYSTFHQGFVLGYLMLGELIAEYGGETEIRDPQFSSRSGSTGGITCFGDPNCKKHSSNGIYHRSKKNVALLRLLSALWQSGFKTIFNHVAVRHLAFKVSSICPILSDTTPEVQGVTQEPLIGWSPLVGWHLHSWVCLRRRFLDVAWSQDLPTDIVTHERRQSDCN